MLDCELFHRSLVVWKSYQRGIAAQAQTPAPSRHVICPYVRLFRLHTTLWRMKVKEHPPGETASKEKGEGLLRDA